MTQVWDELGSAPESDERGTPPELFAELHNEFRFTLDGAASASNALLPRYNSLEYPDAYPWRGNRVFCNPPFSDIVPFVWRATSEADLAVLLVPANRTEQPWWQSLVEPVRDRGQRLTVRFLKGRTRFYKDGKQMGSPNFACCLLIWGAR